ncbi:MAG: FmdB family zinc ribbon protein [Ktedonobacteraceae bacterium]
MPTYEYLCNHCSHRFETWQKMSDDPLTICPKCGEHIRRVLFPAGIVFKGSGFYKTDHANGSVVSENGHLPKSDEAAPAKEGESKPATTESKSGDSKPAESSPGTSSENKVAAEAKAK